MKRLHDAGHEIRFEPGLSTEGIPDYISGQRILVVRSTKVERPAIEAADDLGIIIRAGAGTNTIDKECARENGIAVSNVPGKNAIAVAELTMGLLLSIDRNIPDNVRELREGRWNKQVYSSARGLMGRSLGIVGAGAIGMAVAERAAAFGMQVRMIEKPGRSEKLLEKMKSLGIETVKSMEELASQCDVVTVHVPAAATTKNLVNREFLGQMRDGAILLNTSRGDVVDEPALLQAMNTKSIRAGVDVYANEPAASSGEFDSELAKHPNVYGTHHIGASTDQAQNAVAEGVLEIVDAFAEGRILNCVN